LPNTAFETSFATDRPAAELAERVADVIARFHGLFAASRFGLFLRLGGEPGLAIGFA
jgi:hypothetical protein